jgi:hypothetical protein
MAADLTIGQLRTQLRSIQARWTPRADLDDQQPVPVFTLGGDPDMAKRITQVVRVDLSEIVRDAPAIPFAAARQVALGLRPDLMTIPEAGAVEPGPEGLPPIAGGALDEGARGGTQLLAHVGPLIDLSGEEALQTILKEVQLAGLGAVVDWRDRWGWPWITTTQDQDGCQSCWDFAATGLVEGMARIEHAAWSKRSEGDAHDGMGAKCATTGWPSGALDWMVSNSGVCDPGCYPWKTDDSAYAPCSDRSGRTVKISGYTTLTDVGQQKQWLDSIGPLTCCFDVYDDFFGYGSGVYHRTNDHFDGIHCVLLVGYDDNQQAWLVKNSWGTGWGMNGFGWIGYGEINIDGYEKYGVTHTNPDPWTKRRLHSGALYESGNGAQHRNFELLATGNGSQLRHWWRDGGDFGWHQASTFGNDAAACPTLIGTTYNRNFESVHLTTTGQLHHWWFAQPGGPWNDGGLFGPNDAAGIPGFIQGNYGAPGNFEVVVRTADGRLNHWWRDNGPPWTWHDGGRFGSGVALSGPSLIQSHYGGQGNFELVGVLDTGEMQHWWRDNDHGLVWNEGPRFGSGVESPPCMIEGQFGAGDENAVGNFELCVAVGGQVQHWWRNNQADMSWNQSATFGHDVRAVAALVEGSYGFNLEVVVLRWDGILQHYWRDGAGWHEGPVIGSAQ